METKVEYKVFNRNELARMMLQWEAERRHLDTLEQAIKDTVLQLAETVTTGTVRASYSEGRKQYGYKAGAESYGASVDLWERAVTIHTAIPEPRTDWRMVCRELDIADIPFTQSDPSVTLKIITP